MLFLGTQKVIAIGASTGGVEALTRLFSKLPPTIPPIVLVIHMPLGFTKIFADRLNDMFEFTVKEANSGDYLQKNQVLIAPAGKHMKVVKRNNKLVVECYIGDKVGFVIPSADVLFESVADVMQKNAIGVIMTGLGADGARGLLAMRKHGAITIGQDKLTSAVYGMPKAAKDLGAVAHEVPLSQIADKIISFI